MSIANRKKKVFGEIAALKTLTNGYPKLKNRSSFSSINNENDSLAFLCDLIKSLIGFESLESVVIKILTSSLQDIETQIKSQLKIELKSIISCTTNPSIPDFLMSTQPGVEISLDDIDFTQLFKIDPNSTEGGLLYSNITTPLTNSNSFNTFIKGVIESNNSNVWKSMFNLEFKATGSSKNNVLNTKTTSNYDVKKLVELNNDYIESLSLFNTEELINRLIDNIFGIVSTNKTVSQIEHETVIKFVISKIINSKYDIITDDIFKLKKSELQLSSSLSTDKKNAVNTINTYESVNTSLPVELVVAENTKIKSNNNKEQAVKNTLKSFSDQLAKFAKNTTDKQTIKLNFIQNLLDNLILVIVEAILSPQIVFIFLLNNKIIYGKDNSFTDTLDFLKKNKNLINSVSKNIKNLIIKELLAIVLKEVTKLATEAFIKKMIEKNQSNLTQLLSLVGVSQEKLRQIKGLL